MAGILDYFSQLFGSGQPAPASAQAAQQPAPAQPQQGQQQPQGMLAGLSPDEVQAMIAKARPGVLGTLLGSIGRSGSFNQVQDQITKENLAREMLPQTIALQQQGIRYGQSIQDPALRELYFNDRPAYSEIEKQRLGQTKVGQNETVYGAGQNGDQTLNGAVTLKQGDKLTNTAGTPIASSPAAPIVVGPSSSTASGDTGKIISQAPFEPKPVITKKDENFDFITPGGSSGGAAGADASQPRGIRNNNPWNVTTLSGGQKWAGQTGADGQFAQFGSVKAGAQAADRNLLARYTLHGLNTVQGVIADPKFGWDPGNTQYAAQVAQALGVKPTDPVNLNDPTVRANMLHAMLPIESGRGAPAAVDGGTVQHVRTGAQARQLSPQEAMERGFSPGVVVQTPDGNFEQKAKLSDPEAARIKNMRDAADALEQMSDLDRQFLDLNKANKTGPQYAMGHANPIAWMAERVNPAISTMEGLASKETLANRPAGVGRILQAEIPMFRSSALDPENTYEVNQSKASEHAQSLKYIRDKADFYTNWAYQHGNLAGADEAWSKSRPSSQPSVPAAKRQASRPANAPPLSLPQSGFRFVQ